jgi:hypothetical protein
MVDFVGGRSVKEIIRLKHELMASFAKARTMIVYSTNAIKPEAHYKSNVLPKGCPKSVSSANANGKCPSDDHIPLPNKHKVLCCYKKKLTKTTAQNVINRYRDAQLPLPSDLEDRINALNTKCTKSSYVSSVKLKKATPGVIYNSKQRNFYYKDKKFNCMTMSKPYLEAISLLMKLSPKGFKKDLCEKILKKAQSNANDKYKRARKRLLKMKARYTNMML